MKSTFDIEICVSSVFDSNSKHRVDSKKNTCDSWICSHINTQTHVNSGNEGVNTNMKEHSFRCRSHFVCVFFRLFQFSCFEHASLTLRRVY